MMSVLTARDTRAFGALRVRVGDVVATVDLIHGAPVWAARGQAGGCGRVGVEGRGQVAPPPAGGYLRGGLENRYPGREGLVGGLEGYDAGRERIHVRPEPIRDRGVGVLAVRSSRPLRADLTLGAYSAIRPRGSLLTGWPLRTLRPLRAIGTSRPLGAFCAVNAVDTVVASRPLRAFGTHLALRTLLPLVARLAL